MVFELAANSLNPFPNDKFWILLKLKEFADDNLKFDEKNESFPNR